MPAYTQGLLWLALLLAPFLVLQRSLHREVQAFFLLLTRRQDISLVIFSLLFFPGVLLHETSHFLMALILNVRTGRFSLIPRPLPNGRVQLGYVETARSDFLRDSLIGVAPLLVGGGFVLYVGLVRLGLSAVWQSWQVGTPDALFQAMSQAYHQADFWLWFYLGFTVSSTMLPSASDRRAWLPLAMVLLGLFALSLAAGAGPWMAEHLAPALDRALLALDVAISISLLLHLALLPLFWAGGKLLSRLTGLQAA